MKYQLVSGLETHVELATATKIFCGCTTAFGGSPNTHCCPVCTGQPGTLPVLNKKVVEYAIRAGLATHCTINTTTHLDRKNYCYPDLPKAYQISQFDKPLCEHGYVELESGKRIGITRIHIEEDAGKLVHESGYTYIDYNRGGVPLIEIVSEPDISSPEEAKEYVEKLQLIMRYIGVSDCKMQEGSMRCDVNISVMPEGATEFGTRTEIKNMNSISYIEKAMAYEYRRQIEVIEGGGKIVQATLRYDEHTGETSVMRTKEDAQDYRYFPEPDILTVVIPEEKVEEIRKGLPELPTDKLHRYVDELKINPATAKLLYKYKRVCDFAERAFSLGAGVKNTVNLIVGTLYSKLETEEDKEKFALPVSAEEFAKLVKFVDEGKVNITLAQKTLSKMAEEGKPVTEYIKPEDIAGVDEGELTEICKKAVEANTNAVADFKAGKEKAIFALYGFVKKATQGKADIAKADKIIKDLIK
ncbi:MAG: Asp-tRNA(Asn)/Glu-tRNA(Gln) amidotransferase subunit GatB [Clostridiales bacterium]|nr:Asp-tRNA(Asn)/Glu-tRNA(Gln) amidotransferase subunit GatB [Clostridiales bacterium]